MLSDGRKIAARAETKSVISPATKRPMSEDDIATAIGTFGDMPFTCKSGKNSASGINFDELNIQGGGFLPIAEVTDILFAYCISNRCKLAAIKVKAARRDAAQNLLAQLREHDRTFGMASPSDNTLQNLRVISSSKL